MKKWYFGIFLLLLFLPSNALGQIEIDVNQTTPCFLNETARYNILKNCNAGDDWLQWSILSWDWITGGYFTMFLVTIMIMITYMKYKQAIYPIFIGIVYLPLSIAFFPHQFVSWAIIMAFVGVGTFIWYAYVRQTQ